MTQNPANPEIARAFLASYGTCFGCGQSAPPRVFVDDRLVCSPRCQNLVTNLQPYSEQRRFLADHSRRVLYGAGRAMKHRRPHA